jgi:hypothetical protein
LITNFFAIAIFGAEYNIPIITMKIIIRILAALSVIIDNNTARPLTHSIKIHVCLFETSPQEIGRFFALALSRSASIRSFSMYIPIAIRKEMIGSGRLCCTVENNPICDAIAFRVVWTINNPVTVAKEYSIPHFLRELNNIS